MKNAPSTRDTDQIGKNRCGLNSLHIWILSPLVAISCGDVRGDKANGQSCGAGGECQSGFCVDRVCCNTGCNGQCESCETGACNAVTGAPHNMRAACTGAGSACGGTCDGQTRTSCTYPTTSCAAAACNGSVHTSAASCSMGACTPQTMDCAATTNTKYCDTSAGCLGVTQLAAGYDFTCALMSDSGVMCWGANDYGQLGQGMDSSGNPDTMERVRPTRVPTLTGVAKLSAGTSPNTDGHVCALKNDKTVVCWGANTFGQLGNGTTTGFSTANSTPSPLQQSSGMAQQNVNDLSAGQDFTCFVDTSGRAFCVGANDSGQLGDGSISMRTFPVQAGTAADFGVLWSGYSHTCATVGLSSSTSLRCWGSNSAFEAGVSSGSTVLTPTAAAGLTTVNATLAHPVGTGYNSSCAIPSNSVLQCWGYNGRAQLGRGCDTVGTGGCTAVASTAVAGPVCLSGGPSCSATGSNLNLTTSFAISEQSACAISTRTSGSTLYCWGKNTHAEFGDGTITPGFYARPIGAGAPIDLVMGAYHTCLLYSDHTVKCAGWNGNGQIGNGSSSGGDITTFTAPQF
jgi:alpha-tubulin suppressor-like RCC1 family protein